MERVKNISSTFRALKVGECVELPIDQLPSYSTTYYRTLAPDRAKGFRLSVKTLVEEGKIVVTRKA